MFRWHQFGKGAVAALLMLFCLALPVSAQNLNPVTVAAKLDNTELKPGGKAKLFITAKLEPGWHMYSLTQKPPPRGVRIAVDESGVFKLDGQLQQPKPKVKFDPNFQMDTQTYDGEVTFTVPLKISADAPPGAQKLTAKFTYQVCDEQQCLRPTTKTLELDATLIAANLKPSPTPLTTPTQLTAQTSPTPTPALPSPTPTATPETINSAATSGNVPPAPPDNVRDDDLAKNLKNRGLLGFIGFALIQGFLALLTPCVFPMIPITVSFFTKREKQTSGAAVGQAGFFSLGIIFTYTVLGLALALIAGPSGLNKLAASPWMNLFLTALFVVFALNLFGMFEIKLPSGLISKLDSKAQGGQAGTTLTTLLMGITFTLTSFTCTTAFVGTVLIYATRGDWFWSAFFSSSA
jgi:thiol:disulfide interchange protein DsbD